MTDARFVTLVTQQPRLSVTAIRGQTGAVPAGGYGGWTEVARPKRKSLTTWDGIPPLRVLLPIILGVKPGQDSFVDDVSAATDRSTLERMAQPVSEGAEPPIVRIVGAMIHNDVGWVIEDFDWDSNPVQSRRGFVVRHAVTVHLLEHVTADAIAQQSAAARTRAAAAATSATAAKKAGSTTAQPSHAKTYVVKAGDTLSSIAARLLGNYKRWTDIATLNGLRDPNALHVGQKLRLP